jgi:hypothetical protein
MARANTGKTKRYYIGVAVLTALLLWGNITIGGDVTGGANERCDGVGKINAAVRSCVTKQYHLLLQDLQTDNSNYYCMLNDTDCPWNKEELLEYKKIIRGKYTGIYDKIEDGQCRAAENRIRRFISGDEFSEGGVDLKDNADCREIYNLYRLGE